MKVVSPKQVHLRRLSFASMTFNPLDPLTSLYYVGCVLGACGARQLQNLMEEFSLDEYQESEGIECIVCPLRAGPYFGDGIHGSE